MPTVFEADQEILNGLKAELDAAMQEHKASLNQSKMIDLSIAGDDEDAAKCEVEGAGGAKAEKAKAENAKLALKVAKFRSDHVTFAALGNVTPKQEDIMKLLNQHDYDEFKGKFGQRHRLLLLDPLMAPEQQARP